MINTRDTSSAFHEFASKNRQLLREGKQLLSLLEHDVVAGQIGKPFLLRMALEKYLELIDDSLLPALTDSLKPDRPFKVTPVAGANTRLAMELAQMAQLDTAKPFLERELNLDLVDDEPTIPIARPRVASQCNQPLTMSFCEDARSQDVPGNPMAVASIPEPIPTKTCHGSDPLADDHPGTRRNVPRYGCRLHLKYATRGVDKAMHSAYTKDVGALGLFVLAHRPQKVGNTVELRVEMPDKQVASITGEVRWTKWVSQNLRSVDIPGFGLKITNASENWYSYFMNPPAHFQSHRL